MPGVGKTTVGPLAAQALGLPFVDLDGAIEAAEGRSVEALWADGEARFREAETRVLLALLASATPSVIATGGGAWVSAECRRVALEHALVVHLRASPAALAARLEGGSAARPLLASSGGGASLEAALRRLEQERVEAYAEAHVRVATDGRTPAEVASAVVRAVGFAVWVGVEPQGYPVRVLRNAPAALADWVDAIEPTSVVMVTDENVMALWGATFRGALETSAMRPVSSVVIPAGEEQKSLATLERVLGALHERGADRGSLIVALGGGVVSDLAGLAAALWMRGVRWVAVPTTLLSMVDAAIGGKTAVDFRGAKNVVGAFHQPSAVLIDPSLCATEAPRAIASGLAEAVKTGLVGDAALFEEIEEHATALAGRDLDRLDAVIRRAVAVKAAVVGEDERDTGRRAILNLGHTVGHAVEAHGGFARFTHGEAVAIGVVAMLEVGAHLGVTEPGLADRARALLERLGLPVALPAAEWPAALAGVDRDKKRRGGDVQVVLVRRLGEPVLRYLPLDDVARLVVGAASDHVAKE